MPGKDSELPARGTVVGTDIVAVTPAAGQTSQTTVDGVAASAALTGVFVKLVTASRVNGEYPQWDSAAGAFVSAAPAAPTATTVPFSPTGTIAATNVQAAIAETSGDVTALTTRVTALEAGGTEGQSLTTGTRDASATTTATMLTYTIPANVMGVGDTAIFTQQGDALINDAAVPFPQFQLRLNTTSFADSTGTNPTETSSASRNVWTLTMTVTPRTTTTFDVTFHLIRTGQNATATKFRTLSAGKSFIYTNPPDAPVTINLTVSNTFDVQVAWSATSATCDWRWGPSSFSLVKAPA